MVPEPSSARTPGSHYEVQEMRPLRHTFFKSPKLKFIKVLPTTCSASTLQSRILGLVSWETCPFWASGISLVHFFSSDLHTYSFGDFLHFHDSKLHSLIDFSQISIFRLNLLLGLPLPMYLLGSLQGIPSDRAQKWTPDFPPGVSSTFIKRFSPSWSMLNSFSQMLRPKN